MKLHTLLTSIATILLITLSQIIYTAKANVADPGIVPFSGNIASGNTASGNTASDNKAPNKMTQIKQTQNKSKSSTKANAKATTLININIASADELSSLPGLGAKKAKAIVEYRELNGKFTSTEELVNVKGIGPKMLAKIDGMIAI